MRDRRYVSVLTIAGSDCGGGAGVQADIKTMSALGCYAASAVTALTVQNTLGVAAVMAVGADIVAGQIRAVMDDIRPSAVKIGMVGDAETMHAVAVTLRGYDVRHVVADPVMASTSGERLMTDEALGVFRAELLPCVTLLTPNIPEAEVLSGIAIAGKPEIEMAARVILDMGCGAVLVKGGHMEGSKTDRLYRMADGVMVAREYAADAVVTRNTHGTGCTLSAAIASFLALGHDMETAIGLAKDYVTRALQAGADVRTGGGHGPMNHFFDPKRLIKI